MQVTQTRWHRTKLKGACMEDWKVCRKSLQAAHSYSTQDIAHQEGREQHAALQHSSSPFTLQTRKNKSKLLARKAILC